MTTPELSHWLKVDITLKHMGDLSTKTISVTNRAEISDTDSDSWPILEQISRLGSSSDRESILPDAGNLRIIDSIGSFGVERKFSDLFERYTLIDQPIEIFYASTQAETLDPASYTSVFKGKGLDWVISTDSVIPLIDIRFDARLFAKRFISRRVNNLDFTNAPSKSIGKHLPIVIGAGVQVRPVQISADGATIPTYAYATTLASEHPVSGVANYYVKVENEYKEVRSASAVSTAVFDSTAGVANSSILPEYACFLNHDPSTENYIITQVQIYLTDIVNGAFGAVVDGLITLRIYEGVLNDSSIPSDKVVAIATRDGTEIDTLITTTPFEGWVDFTLDKPLIMTSSNGYWLSIQQEVITAVGSNPTDGVTIYAVRDSTIGGDIYTKTSTGTWKDSTLNGIFNYKFYGVKFTDDPSGTAVDNQGLAYADVELTQTTAISGYTNPDISKLDLIFSVNGLKDDSSGTITGSANSLIERVDHAVKLLAQEYSASTGWALSSSWSFSGYSSTYYQGNTIKGKSEGEETFEGFLRKICRNS